MVSIPAGFSDALRLSGRHRAMADAARFQSLLGFLMRCDETHEKQDSVLPGFQSLLGFLMRCDTLPAAHRCLEDTVSIPAGFSDALRQNAAFTSLMPYRFQSLMGFLMRCDIQAA